MSSSLFKHGTSKYTVHDRPDRRVTWEWNIPLLVYSSIAVVIVAGLGAASYWVQSTRIATGLLAKAEEAASEGDLDAQAKWLRRYTQLAPNDKSAMYEFALSLDSQVKDYPSLARARDYLLSALGLLGSSGEDLKRRDVLRRRLIERLLQDSPIWASEAERHVKLLELEPEDPDGTRWLAQSLVKQRDSAAFKLRNASSFDKTNQYWDWLASQTTGDVLLTAYNTNPEDVRLASVLTAACVDRPEWFDTDLEEADRAYLGKVAAEAANRLEQNTESALAQMAAYRFFSIEDPQRASRILEHGWKSALERIPKLIAKVPDSGSEEEEAAPLNPIAEPLTHQELNWNWRLVLQAGVERRTNKDTQQSAIDILSKLVQLDSGVVLRESREEAFLQLAGTQADASQTQAAISTLKTAIESIPESLRLVRLLAVTYLREKDWESAGRAASNYRQEIENRILRLDGPEGARLGKAARESFLSELKFSTWQSDLLTARVWLQQGRDREAIKVLEQCFRSKLPINNMQLASAGGLLASLYAKQGLWDLAGEVYERCLILQPQETEFRLAAANAWRRAGVMDRVRNLSASLDDGSFSAALESIAVTVAMEAQKPKGQADLFLINNKIGEARNRLEDSTNEEDSELAWRLRLYELLYPVLVQQLSGDADSEQSVDSEKVFLDGLEELMEGSPDTLELQTYLVAALSDRGRLEAAEQALANVISIRESSGTAEAKAMAGRAQAGMLIARGKIEQAVEIVKQTAKSLENDPMEMIEFVKAGADLALRANDTESAFRLLRSAPDETAMSIDLLVKQAELAVALMEAGDTQPLIDFDLSQTVEKLKAIEGKQGSYWRYVQLQSLVLEAKRRVASNQGPGNTLEEASKLSEELLIQRPYWGKAAFISAEIAALKNYSREAIRLYKQAIRNGDQSVRTRMQLASRLISIGQVDQAKEVVAQMPDVSGRLVPLARMSAIIASRSGDNESALDYARAVAKNQPGVNSLLLLAEVASTMASGVLEDSERQSLIDEAQVALDAALERANSAPTAWLLVLQNRRTFHRKFGMEEKARAELDQMLTVDWIPVTQRLLAAGQGFLELGEVAKAKEALESSLKLDPKSADALLLLSNVHIRLGDIAEAKRTLQLANKLSPTDARIARQLVLLMLNEDEIEWQEVDRLSDSEQLFSSAESILIKAAVSLTRGDEARKARAVAELESIADSPGIGGIEAKRLLAGHFADQWLRTATEVNDAKTISSFERASNLYQAILREPEAGPQDNANYAGLLVKATKVERQAGRYREASNWLRSAERALEKLESKSGSSIASLQLKIEITRLKDALEQGNMELEDEVASIAEQWVTNSGVSDAVGDERLFEIVGKSLVQLGFAQQALSWLEKIYQSNPSRYQPYVVGLTQAKQYDRAIEICVKGYHSKPDASAAALLAEVAMLNFEKPLPAEAQEILDRSLADFPGESMLYESFGTLQLLQGKYQQAVQYYEQAEKARPGRIRVLNNLAIALTKIPGREQEALVKIKKALAIQGSSPELVDTLGTVQLALGNSTEAERAFRQACTQSSNPAFRLHLVDALLLRKDSSGGRREWDKLPHGRMSQYSLTEEDTELYLQLKKKMGQ